MQYMDRTVMCELNSLVHFIPLHDPKAIYNYRVLHNDPNSAFEFQPPNAVEKFSFAC